jgi:hypothetical protein
MAIGYCIIYTRSPAQSYGGLWPVVRYVVGEACQRRRSYRYYLPGFSVYLDLPTPALVTLLTLLLQKAFNWETFQPRNKLLCDMSMKFSPWEIGLLAQAPKPSSGFSTALSLVRK